LLFHPNNKNPLFSSPTNELSNRHFDEGILARIGKKKVSNNEFYDKYSNNVFLLLMKNCYI
jgi:hypothetical protein